MRRAGRRYRRPAMSLQEFLDQRADRYAGAFEAFMCALGDRLGLWKALAEGPATSAEVAARAGLNERYVREWLNGVASASLVERRDADRFALGDEAHAVFAEEGGEFFMGGTYQLIFGLLEAVEPLSEAFRTGEGIPQDTYSDDFWIGLERHNTPSVEHKLVQGWLAAMPEVRAKLESGVRMADVGCGNGRVLIKLAQEFPASEYVGFDLFPGSVERATELARAAGVSDRVSFRVLDGTQGVPEPFHVIGTFDVVHDTTDPLGLLRSIREALEP